MASAHTDSSSAPSAAPSPATTMSSAPNDAAAPPAADNSLDDIFGSSPPHETRDNLSAPVPVPATAEPSDLPSLRRQHVTAGYRDGIATSKGAHVQDGFDAGFPVGAQLGMRAGTILGILEGITRGLEDRAVSGVVKKPAGSAARQDAASSTAETTESRRRMRERVLRLYQDAAKALDVQAVFTGFEAGAASMRGRGPELGAGDEGRDAAGAKEKAEAQLARKGGAVVSTWEDRVSVPRWEENMEALEMRESRGGADEQS
ncbi:uncharacterized protein N7459_000576 [Penicillium hispanicum]|uniref:uncharacterized protein n=1 Tax=Penicillium hispanicum TaxID=1080232 RepID=UPI00254236A2|nr:uncharacterized protein N7459_000576 [Penicillium hispanicum]KAJ5594368.1 hypothetical protein N7459_000576 [Penicillium hispanicum]